MRRESMREDIWDVLTKAIIDVLQCDKSELQPETSFEGDLGADSLDAYQIILQIQEEKGVEFLPEQVEGLVTLQDAYDLLVRLEEEGPEDFQEE